jgi:hypothetical protein
VWGVQGAIEELQQGDDGMFDGALVSVWTFFLRFVCPLFIFVIVGRIVWDALF